MRFFDGNTELLLNTGGELNAELQSENVTRRNDNNEPDSKHTGQPEAQRTVSESGELGQTERFGVVGKVLMQVT